MIMRKLAFATSVALGLTTAAGAQQPSPQPTPRATDQIGFQAADTNGDGRVNREEAKAIVGFDFPRADTNDDAVLTRHEFKAAMGSTSTPRDGAAASDPLSGQGAGATATAQLTFDAADKNKDGRVNREEAKDVRGLNFSSADANDDASLNRQEFQTAMAGVQPRG